MVIGISSPISIGEFLPHLDNVSQKRAREIRGLLAPAVDAFALQLLRQGHEVVIFTLDPSVCSPMVLTGSRLKMYVGRYRRSAKWRGLTFFYSEICALRSFIREEEGRLDVLHAQWSYEFALAALAARCPVFCTIRDIAEEVFKLTPDLYRLIRRLMNAYVLLQKRVRFVANSPYTAKCIRHYHPSLSICAVVPNPCGISVRETISVESEMCSPPVIVSVSQSLGRRKNIRTLVEAFRLVRIEVPEAELHLIGGEFSSDKCGGAFAGDGVVLCGAIAHWDLPKKLAQATLMVHPSLEESFGNTLIEAMACGVPVIGGEKSGAVPYVLDGGKAGLLCNVSDVSALAKAIVSLLRDKTRRCALAQAGLARVRTVFSVEAVTYQLVGLYERALA